ncbi:YdeI/OmpD-associated family protein [Anaeropeptidivorans aminofermentans]|uniref:YdeI/OmpD-associated family protein n=1 Tax=Anaeropeptidivorans aminofermentans TaxID=2934315 RepID=UPI002023EED7|nr:YdeI/OmpD-associated family protein [Anaeropeptidivorans aminofermentans]MBE6011778.1 hypothetical protein [Lachnospiraceae bacterium]
MENKINTSEIPIGLSMALAQDLTAMSYFAGLPRYKQNEIIEQTHSIQSKEEMQSFVASLRKGL